MSAQVRRYRLHEMPGLGRLGRHVEHDPRSRTYPVLEPKRRAPALKSVLWPRRSLIFNQGTLGSCTGNAAAGWLATDTAARPGRAGVTEKVAIQVYEQATVLDGFPGRYPPTDTGSSGLAAAKALVKLGLTAGPYRHAFSLRTALRALQTGPVLFGQHWHEGMDHPDAYGQVHPTGSVRGGHETLIVGVDVDGQLVRVCNSWGPTWGDHGHYLLSWTDLDQLLHEQGDITVPS